jgi:excisionase family DNA binding protein
MKYYSPEEIAEQFNLQAQTVRLWIRQGKLKAIKLGNLWRISEEEMERFIKAGQGEDLSEWTESEQARRREVEAGRAVVCNIDTDLRLKAWAEDKGLSVYIGRENKKRGMAESKWHNPSNKGGRKKMIEDFINHYWASQHLQDSIGELKAKVLVCYCYSEACHGDFLAEQANKQ